MTALAVIAAGWGVVPRAAVAHIPHDEVAQVVVSPAFARDDTVFAVVRERLLRSTDGGLHWNEIVSGIDRTRVQRIAAAASDADVWYLVLSGGVYRSDVGGVVWRPTGFGGRSDVIDVMVSPVDARIVLAATAGGGLFRSADGGATWSQVLSPGAVSTMVWCDTTLVVAGRDAVWRSDDRGDSWSRSAIPTGTDRVSTGLCRKAGTIMLGTGRGQLYRSEDRGASFARVGATPQGESVTGLAVADQGRALWVTTARSAYESLDGGRSLQRNDDGLTTDSQAAAYREPQFNGVVTASAGGEDRLFIAGFDGLFVSDGGAPWREQQTQAEQVTGLAVSPSYARDRTIIATTYVKGVFLTRDSGATWQSANRGLESTSENKVAPLFRLNNVVMSPAFERDGTVFSSSLRTLVKSTDGGRTWRVINVGPPPGPQARFVIALSPNYASDRTVVLGTMQGRTWISRGGGEPGTWSPLTPVGPKVTGLALSPDFANDATIWAATPGGAFRSTDGGRSWQPTGPRGQVVLSVSPEYGTDGTVFVGTLAGLWVTRDRGQRWSHTGVDSLGAARPIVTVAVSPTFRNDGLVLATALGRGLFVSHDSGRTFAPTARGLLAFNLEMKDYTNPTTSAIQFSPGYATDRMIVGFAERWVLRSVDEGATWQLLGLPVAPQPVVRPGRIQRK